MKGSFFEVARYDRSSKSFLAFELLAEKDWKKPKITSLYSYHIVTIQALRWLFSRIYRRSQTGQSVHRKHLKQFNLLTKCSGNSWAALKDVAGSLSFENMNHMELLWSLYLCRILVADLPKISSKSIVSKSATNLRFAKFFSFFVCKGLSIEKPGSGGDSSIEVSRSSMKLHQPGLMADHEL